MSFDATKSRRPSKQTSIRLLPIILFLPFALTLDALFIYLGWMLWKAIR